MKLSENLLRLRLEHKYSQREMANRAKVSAVHISTMERGLTSNVGIDTVERLAKAFNITISELLGEVETTTNTQVDKVTAFVYKDLDGVIFTPDELYLIQLANQMALAKILQDRQ